MADEFNLVPTNNIEKHLDNILRTAQGEEPQYDLAPNWRVEQYLAAIASAIASGGGGGSGGVLVVHDVKGTLDKTWQEIYDADFAVVKDSAGTHPVVECVDTGTKYLLRSIYYNGEEFNPLLWMTTSADGYPT